MSGTIESQLRYHAKHPDTPLLMRHWALKALEELKYRAEVIEQRNAELSRGHADFMQAITDPENQPSQWGTVTLAMYEKRELDSDAALHAAEKEIEYFRLKSEANCSPSSPGWPIPLRDLIIDNIADACFQSVGYQGTRVLMHQVARAIERYHGIAAINAKGAV